MNILIIKTSSLGDILQASHILKYLKNKFKDAQITWVLEKPFKEIFLEEKVQEVIIDSKKWRKNFFKKENFLEFLEFRKKLQKKRYDIVFDLQGNTKSAIITFLAKSKTKVGFSKKYIKEWPNLFFTNNKVDIDSSLNMRFQYLDFLKNFFKDNINHNDFFSFEDKHFDISKRLKIMVCPAAKWPNKQLSFDTLKGFLSLIEKNLKVDLKVIWGSDEEKKIAFSLKNELTFCEVIDKKSISDLKNIMKTMDIIIAMDSAPLHLVESNIFTFSIFGPTKAEIFHPIGKNHFYYQGVCPYNIEFKKVCPKLRSCKTGSCIKNIKSEDLFNSFKRICKKD